MSLNYDYQKCLSEIHDISKRLHELHDSDPVKKIVSFYASQLLENGNLTQIQIDYLVTVIKFGDRLNDYYLFKTIISPLMQIHEKYNDEIDELTREVNQLTVMLKERDERVNELRNK